MCFAALNAICPHRLRQHGGVLKTKMAGSDPKRMVRWNFDDLMINLMACQWDLFWDLTVTHHYKLVRFISLHQRSIFAFGCNSINMQTWNRRGPKNAKPVRHLTNIWFWTLQWSPTVEMYPLSIIPLFEPTCCSGQAPVSPLNKLWQTAQKNKAVVELKCCPFSKQHSSCSDSMD